MFYLTFEKMNIFFLENIMTFWGKVCFETRVKIFGKVTLKKGSLYES